MLVRKSLQCRYGPFRKAGNFVAILVAAILQRELCHSDLSGYSHSMSEFWTSFGQKQFTAEVRTERLPLNSRHKRGNFSAQWYPHCSSDPPVFLSNCYGLLFVLELSRSKRETVITLDCIGLEFANFYLHMYISKVVPCLKMTAPPTPLRSF